MLFVCEGFLILCHIHVHVLVYYCFIVIFRRFIIGFKNRHRPKCEENVYVRVILQIVNIFLSWNYPCQLHNFYYIAANNNYYGVPVIFLICMFIMCLTLFYH